MNMKFIAIVMTGLALTSVVESAEAGVNQRERNQKERIAKGLKPGNGLNFREARKLINGQVAIRDAERAFRNSGAGLNKGEKKALNTLLDAESQRIRNFKNN
jgi:hypothetical protein